MTTGDTGGEAPACNIGGEETARRRRVGYFGLGLSILWILAVELFSLGLVFRLMIFIPAAVAFSGFLQARARFCMAYGAQGVTSLDGLQQFTRSANITGDRRRAFRMFAQVILLSTLVTVLFMLLG